MIRFAGGTAPMHIIPGELINDPQHWRGRAWAARTKAGTAKDFRSKRIMLRIAESYERLAEGVERRLRREGDSSCPQSCGSGVA
jgi:hypothetical protein